MSRTIDERVVSMQFDNKNFESNVRTSLGTIDKLKQSLNFAGASKGLENINSAVKNVNMSPLGSAVESVGLKFNAMYTMADQALRNITNSAVNAGKRIVSALTIDPVKTGFSEYETKIGSIQTIMSNTASKGTTMDDVTRVIDELNTYADKTIYNFAEMTRNIGTFTAAGVGLEESAAAIQGIANLAASSGSTSQQASTAMYQLSQALAAGTVKLMDWNSVVNAGMGGEKFQEALKATARDHGVAVDDIIKKNGSFRESLQDGWITADILNETLNKFTVDGAKNYAKSMVESGKWTQKQADALVAEAQAMEDAATKVKTFTQLWDTLKESAQSGWGKTWELIVGDFDQAKDFWTKVSDVFGGIIEKSSDARNNLIEGALTSNWDKFRKKLNEAGIETSKFEESVTNLAKENGQDVDALVKKYGSLENAIKNGKISADILKKALKGLGKISANFDLVKGPVKRTERGDHVKQIEDALVALGYDLKGKDGKFYGGDGYFGTVTEDAIKSFQKLKGLKVTGIVDDETLKALKEATEKSNDLGDSLTDLIDDLDKLGGRDLLIKSLKNVFEGLKSVIVPIKSAFRDIFPPMTSEQLYNIIERVQKLTSKFKLSMPQIRNLHKTFKGLFAAIDIVARILGGGLKIALEIVGKVLSKFDLDILSVTGAIGDAIVKFRDWLIEGNKIVDTFDKAIDVLVKFAKQVYAWIKAFLELPEVQASIENIKMEFANFSELLKGKFKGGLEQLKAFIDRVKSLDSISLKNIGDIFKDFKDNVLGYFVKTDTGTIFDGLINSLKTFKDKAVEYLESAGIKIKEIGEKIRGFIEVIKTNVKNNLGGLLAIGVLVGFFLIVKKITDTLSKFAKPLEFLDDLSDVLKDLGKAIKTSIKATAVKNVAISIAIMAGALTVLAMLPYGKLWSAVGALFVVSATLAGVIFVMSKVSDKLGDLAKLSGAVLAMAGSMLVLAFAAKVMSGIDWDDLAKCGVALAAFVGAIAIISKTSSGIGSVNFAAFGSMMMGLSAALLIFSVAIGILGNMKLDTLLQGGAAIGVFLLMMAGMMKATKPLSASLPKFATTMAGLAAALLIFSISIGILGNMDFETLMQGGLAVIGFLGLMVGMMAATKLLAKDMPKFATTMFGLSFGLLAMAAVVRIIGGLDPETMVKGGLAVTAFLGMMVGMMAATKLLGTHSKHAAKVGLMMLSFAGALLIISAVVAILGNMEGGKIAKAIAAIAGISLLFAGLIAVTKFAKAGKGIKATIMSMAIAIGILAVSIAALSFVDGDKIKSATASLAAVIGMFAVLVASTKLLKGGFASIATILVMAGVVAVLGYVIKELCKTPVDKALSIAGALSILIISLSASCALLGVIGLIGPAALIGVGVLAALMAVLAIFAAIAISSLPTIGKQLSDFMTNLQPFVEGAKNIDPSIMSGVETIADVILKLTAANILQGIGSWLTGGQDFSAFGTQLIAFGKGIKGFSDAVSGVDATVITTAAEAAKSLLETTALIPNTGGIVDWFTGSQDITAFSTQLIAFGNGIKGFSEAVTGIDTTAVTSAASVAKTLIETTSLIPNTGGIIDWFTGSQDITAFGSQLVAFGTGIKGFSDSVVGIDTAAVTSGANVAKTLIETTSLIPSTGGIIDWFTGSQNLTEFASQLAYFGMGIKGFSDSVVGIDTAAVTSGANVAKTLIETTSLIPSTGGIIDWFTGSQDLSGFSSQLAYFGMGIKGFADSIIGIDTASVASAATAAKTLIETTSGIPNTGGIIEWFTGSQNLTGFASQLAYFGIGIKGFSDSVIGIDTAAVTSASKVAKTLIETTSTIPNSGGIVDWFTGSQDLSKFGSQLISFGDGIKGFSNSVIGLDEGAVTAASSAGKTLAEMANTIPTSGGLFSWFTGDNDMATFGSQLAKFGEGIKNFSDKVVGIDATAITAASNAGKTLSDMASSMPENIGMLGFFGDQLVYFGYDIKTLSESMDGVSTTQISSVVTQVNGLIDMVTKASNVDFSGISSFGESLGEIGEAGIDGFVNAFNNAMPKVKTLGGKLLLELIAGATSKKNLLTSSFKGTLNSVVDTIRDYNSKFKSAGKYLVEGFVDGIDENTFKAEAEAAAMAKAALKAAEEALGVESPSKEFYKIGDFSILGFANALHDGFSRVYNSSSEMGEYAKRGFSNAISKVSDILNSGFDDQPTIRPVVDLSEVTASAGMINGMFGMNPSIGVMSNVRSISSMMNNRQNGVNRDIIDAIEELGVRINSMGSNNYYSLGDVTYDDGSNVSNAVKALVNAVKVERRV